MPWIGRVLVKNSLANPMPILDLLKNNPTEVYALELPQIVAICGNGQLVDDQACSTEFRDFLSRSPSSKLGDYARRCLAQPFDRSGLALQDVVNELGRRLDYKVTRGLYQGRKNVIGFDGIWENPSGSTLVVEVKTTDAYRISLDTIATYRSKLVLQNKVSSTSSILIVVGRQDTGELEAQVRGSRHAWDVRLISVDALIKLVHLKEETEQDTTSKIWDILSPFEYTRVDRIIEIAFTAATEATEDPSEEAVESGVKPSLESDSGGNEGSSGTQVHTPQAVIEQYRRASLARLESKLDCNLVRRTKATYWSPDSEHAKRAACSVSKRHATGHYWYAYHPAWDEFLAEAAEGYFVLSCVGLESSFALPRDWLRQRLPLLNKTVVSDDKHYWHIHLHHMENGRMGLRLHRDSTSVDISQFLLVL